MKRRLNRTVGVVGTGSFGTAISNILAANSDVLLYGRNAEGVDEIRKTRVSAGQQLNEQVRLTSDIAEIATTCSVIFPIVSSAGFREMMQGLGPLLHPYHILIHGTKGLDIQMTEKEIQNRRKFDVEKIKTMSQVILDESPVVRVGCLAGPNLARELADKQPAATVVASHFEEVIHEGQRLLRNDRFRVYGNEDLRGIELAGVLKNIIAIASGALSGLGLGENARALLVSRGMVEMIHLGKALGGEVHPFLGIAGIGDLVATCASNLSRNFTVGYRLARGETLQQILSTMEEVAEGVNTVHIMKFAADYLKVRAPITEALYQVLFGKLSVERALEGLMRFPLHADIDFLD